MISDGMVNRIEKIMRDFLWSRVVRVKKNIWLDGWYIVGRSKDDCGLGLGNLMSKKVSLMAKLLCQIPLL